MGLSVNVNVPSLNAQRNLSRSQGALATSLQRLSSGLRLNSAKDDAAGIAIAARFTTQIRGLNVAARNANDGISLSQTAEGALNEVINNLQRIRELAVQSANSTNSTTDRKALNAEATALVNEIDRVAQNTNFNGVKLLDGTFTSQDFQVGANGGGSNVISISNISSARTSALGVGSGSSYSTTDLNNQGTTTTLAAGDVTINGYQVGATASDGVSHSFATGSAIAKVAAINAISGNTNVTATVDATAVNGAAIASTQAISAGDIKLNGVDLGAFAAATAATRSNDLAAKINSVSAQTGVTATFGTSTNGGVTLSAADGRNITLEVTDTSAASRSGFTSGTNTTVATFDLSSTDSGGITLGGTAAGLTAAGFGSGGYQSATATVGAGVSSLDLTTASGSTNALTIIDAALATVNSSRGDLGAIQNRFSSTIVSIQTTSENLSASRSRIEDADFAQETAALARGQILQQSGIAILAQANSLPQSVLALLQ
ncbi:MAG: flagellin [Nitrospiria bacterium]